MALCTACACCGAGVRRAHLVDASVDGSLLLELYSAEGAANASMVSSDFYQVPTAPPPPPPLDSTGAPAHPIHPATAPESAPAHVRDLPTSPCPYRCYTNEHRTSCARGCLPGAGAVGGGEVRGGGVGEVRGGGVGAGRASAARCEAIWTGLRRCCGRWRRRAFSSRALTTSCCRSCRNTLSLSARWGASPCHPNDGTRRG